MPILLVLLLLNQSPPPCADAADCRRQSVDAAARGEYEQAHDYAWRAIQKGKKNDPDLMLVLARAQSLSGRPGDALVMLGRIVDLGGTPDIANDPDFARVRALPDWAALGARLTGAPPPATVAAPAAPPASAPSAPPASVAPAPSAPLAPLHLSHHYRYGVVYGGRCGRDSQVFASSSFLKRSLSGSQYSLRFDFMAM